MYNDVPSTSQEVQDLEIDTELPHSFKANSFYEKKTPHIIYVHMIIDICWYLIRNVYLCFYYFWRRYKYIYTSYTILYHPCSHDRWLGEVGTFECERSSTFDPHLLSKLEKDHFGATEERGEMEKNSWLVVSCFVFMNRLMISPSIDENQEVLK